MEKLIPTFSEFVNENLNEELSVEDQLEKLIQGDVESISISYDDSGNTEVTVFISGNEIGYDDDQWYDITWLPKTEEIESGTYKDRKFKKFVTASNWSGKVKNVKDFAAVINGDAKGEWE
jgi:hypothetical protein